MAILKTNTEDMEVENGGPVVEAAEELGVPFGCFAGVCGTCKVTVLAGIENLEDKTDEEEDMDLEDNERLMCQAVIVSGTVVIEPA